jgi:hypothetical protein
MGREDSASTAAPMLKIFLHMGIPKILQGDKKIIDSFEKELSPYFPGITLFTTKPHETNKNAIVERVIRTLKNYILQYLYVHPFPVISGRFVTEEYYFELDTTTMILQEVCTLRNNTFHRTIHQKPFDVFMAAHSIDKSSQKRNILNFMSKISSWPNLYAIAEK